MEITRWFTLPDGRLRAGWRLLLFILFFLVAMILFQGAVAALLRREATSSQLAVLATSGAAGLGAILTVTWLMLSAIERQPFSAVGLPLRKKSLRQIGFGAAAGASMIGAITAIEWGMGAIRFQYSDSSSAPTLLVVAGSAAVLAVSAISEELLFRGYPFQRLLEGTNVYFAVTLSSVLFGALHMANPHATGLAVVNTVLAGMFLSLAYVKTGALWLPIAFHFSWNWALSLAGLPISGVGLRTVPWEVAPAETRTWLHGGDYGPEGGVVATGVLLAAIWCLFKCRITTDRNSDGPPPSV